MSEPLEIPTPDTVMLQALYDDKLADSLIEQFNIMWFVERYSGKEVSMPTTKVEGLEDGSIFMDHTIGVINRKLHQHGWHLEQVQRRYEWLLILDKWIPPSQRLTFLQRLNKAFRILIGDEY